MRPKKSLGQHFLTSEDIARRIAKAGECRSGDAVLEIGPGTGMLTALLLQTGAKVIAIEKDDRAIPLLETRFKAEIGQGSLKIIHGDILEDQKTLVLPKKYKVIANIPYYITGALMRRFLETDHQPSVIVFLVQKEVADRIALSKKASILSLSVKAYGNPTYIETVPARFFKPVPKVDSAILKIDQISKEYFSGFSEKVFFNLLHLGFSQKRKKLLGNLSRQFDKETIHTAFSEFSISENIRAEDFALEGWKRLALKIEKPPQTQRIKSSKKIGA